MKLHHSLLSYALSVATLATACSSDDGVDKSKSAATACDDDKVGDDCNCDDDGEVTGTMQCNSKGDDLECVCDDPTDDDDEGEKPKDAGKKDSTVPKTDAKTPKPDASVPVVDSGDDKPAEVDAGEDPPEPVSGDKPDPSKLPKVNGACPDLKDGTITVAGAKVQIWVGSKPGPVYLYFHGTSRPPSEIDQGIAGATAAVKTEGGIAASWDTSNSKGTNTGTIWYTGDMEAADQLIACGIEKNLVDTSHIHVAGYSAGGLETGAFIVGRNNYVASVIVYSGGKPFGAGGAVGAGGHVPSMVGAHGAAGSDSLGLDFGTQTPALGKEVAAAGGFVIDCDDGSSHIDIGKRFVVGSKARDFFKAHAWGVKPWTAVPAGWPSNCKVLSK